MAARGTAERLDYKRAGGWMHATHGAAQVMPQPGTGLASYGWLQIRAPEAEGEFGSKRGRAWGGVDLDAQRGDKARTEAVQFDDQTVRSETPVAASGPGYRVDGQALVARSDGSEIRLTRGVRGELQMEARR